MRLDLVYRYSNACIETIFPFQRFVSFLIIRLKLDDEDSDVMDDAFLLLMIVDDEEEEEGALIKVLDDVGCLFMLTMLVLLLVLV